jgi:hypothetical protein
MKPIAFEEIKNIYDYEKVRADFRAMVIDEKKVRRIHLGDKMTLVFENRNSVLFQIQEMIRVERIITDEAMKHEVEAYNVLVPGKNELSATLLIDINDPAQIKPVLDSLVGLNNDSFFIAIGERRFLATFDDGQAEDDRISAVQYLKWCLDDEAVTTFADPKQTVSLICTHPNYSFEVALSPETRAALLGDLAESEV